MLRISEKDGEIIIRDIALGDFVRIGLSMSVTLLLLYFGSVDVRYFSNSFIFFLGLLSVLCISIYHLGFVQTRTIRINRQKRILSIHNDSLVKKIFKVYRFGEISDLIFIETLTDKEGKKSHKLVFPLETGERIVLSRSVSSGEDEYLHAATVINNVVFSNAKQIQ